ncbi:Lrp/AsnC family transcriptional regulator [Oceanibacterium hippocampi]|uniref:Leucine-responsive regulatory protein n=1 Tax=Oceanibacterium hippocampi TaxID=745714 RepID=A0A1Y5S1L3_9PROT|nr:Lrp/AsnC family transcriptional regulator [Oceanibacterium hippocampi]SLN30398.1 Leucine-responsive regulatory protein [Oceanibacterium hippocampi]
MILEKSDRRILAALQENSRLTNQQLAERAGLSAAACWRRVKALEETGVIRRYTALLDPKKVGQGECVFAHISLERHTMETTEAFVAAVRRHPEILECYATTGEADYLLRVVVPEIAAYDRFLRDFVFQLPCVARVHSNFALREVKWDSALPVGEEAIRER